MQTKNYFLLYLLLLGFLGSSVRAQTFDLTFNLASAAQMTITEPTPGTYDIATTGNDARVSVNPFMPGPYDPNAVYVISFEYIATSGLDDLEIFYGAVSAARKASYTDLKPSDTFRTFKAFMNLDVDNWNSSFQALRFDISKLPGANITIRNIQLREPTATEVIPLTLDPANINTAATTVTDNGDGTFTIATSGADPYIASMDIGVAYDPTLAQVLTYDYIGTDDLDDFRVFFADSPAWTATQMSEFGALPASPGGDTFTGLMALGDEDWLTTPATSNLRFDFGRQPNKTITVSNFILREPTHEECKLLLPPEVLETICIELDINQVSPNGQMQATESGTDPIEYQLTTVGPDPWIRTKTITDAYDINESYIIEFEYKASAAYNELQIFHGPPINAANSFFTPEIPAAAIWTTYTLNPRLITDNFQNDNWTDFRIDFGRGEDPTVQKTFDLRNLKIRKPTAQELIDEQNSDKFLSQVLNAEFVDYLAETFPEETTEVEVTMDKVIVKGTVSGPGPYFLGEILPSEYGFNKTTFTAPVPLTIVGGAFCAELDRLDQRADRDYDRLYSRWVVLESVSGDEYEQVSAACWPTCIPDVAINNLEECKAETIKGLDGLTNGSLPNFSDLTDLDIKSMKINLILNATFSLGGNGGGSHTFNGKTYGINQTFVNNMDARVKACTDAGIKVSFVLLIPIGIVNPDLNRIFVHPDANLGLYTMANVTSAEGVEHYTMLVDFLSERYSRPDKQFGRVDQWIIHNEVDAHTAWTHAGQKPAPLYTQLYDRSMRMVHYTIRKHNPTAKVFSSFTKHWNSKVGGANSSNFRSKEILTVLGELMQKEGDYEWGIGWHSYPTNLRNPQVWNDNVAATPLNLNAQQITPRNLEMIDAYVRQFSTLYNGKKVRTILLSENGFSSNTDPTMGGNAAWTEERQAAAVAYFWKKADKRLPAIENIQYHRWIDNANEGNLLFGLRRNIPGTTEGFGVKKPSWDVWQAAGTANEDAVFMPYLSVVGINDWSEIQYTVPTDVTPWPVTMNITSCTTPVEELLVEFNGEKRYPQPDGTVLFYNVASNVVQDYKILEEGVQIETGDLMVTEATTLDLDLCALPVEFLSFTAEAFGKVVELNWETTTEEENAGFTVERSAEGRNWTVLEQVAAKPAGSIQFYGTLDAAPLNGTSYYRLIQRDYAGETTVSPVRQVTFSGTAEALILTPNPSSDVVNFRLPAGFEAKELQLIDASGRMTAQVPPVNGRLQLAGNPKGVYLLRAVAADGQVLSAKLVLQ